ncbi:MAG: zinc ribbon domain-containing protein [Bacteroidota bacterium]
MAKSTEEIKTKQQNTSQNPETEEGVVNAIEKKLVALYTKQKLDTKADKIRIIRGELPLEVQDLEDELAGLETRLSKYQEEIEAIEKNISDKQNLIKESRELIKKYEEQQMKVRNNREYDSISKELEYQNLEIQLAEKRIKESEDKKAAKQEEIDKIKSELEERKKDLEVKKNELEDIVSETEKEENDLVEASGKVEKDIEPRLLTAYKRIRENARNGLAVVKVERDACGGCFSKIPPQRQLDIRTHKKIIVCEYCGRILIDDDIAEKVEAKLKK